MGYRGKTYRQSMNDVAICTYNLGVEKDDLGFDTNSIVKIPDVPCNIQSYSGQRLLQYQSAGYNYPMQITMRKGEGQLIGLNVEGIDLTIKSIQEDNYNSSNIIVMADKPILQNDNG